MLNSPLSRFGWLVHYCPALLFATACVAQDAGYADVRRSTLAQHGMDVRWRAVDAGGRIEERTRELIAKPLTGDTAVQVALLNSPDVQVAFEELGLARADIVRAIRLPNPVAEGSIHFHDEGPEYGFGVLIALNDLLFLPWRSGAAHATLDAAKLAVAGAILDIALEVRIAYFRYVAAKQIAELRRTVLLAARGAYDSAQALHEAGNITDLDLANERALYEDTRLLVARAERDQVKERARLTSLMGLAGAGIQWSAPARLPDADVAEGPPKDVERRALENSMDLELARRRYTAAGKQANLARAEGLVPELRAGAMGEKETDQGWGFGPTAQIELPLFYQGGGEVARARSEMRTQQGRYLSAAMQVRAAVQEITSRLETARSAVVFYRDVQLPLREHIVQQTQLQFNAMNVGVFQLLQAKREQIETLRDYVETQRDYWIARSELEQLLAGRLVRVREDTTPDPERNAGSPASH